MKLALGTVQFGMDYGLAKQEARTPDDEVGRILDLARSRGMSMLDTATSYGGSEEVLGRKGVEGWQIVTKLTAIPETTDPETWIRNELANSLERLDVDSVYGVLLHQPGQLNGDQGKHIHAVLDKLKTEGLFSKIGVSIYDPEELAGYLDTGPLDLVQAPINIVDRRLVTSGWLERLTGMGVEVHARSVFLQGLLLMKDDERPEKFNRWSSLWQDFNAWLAMAGLSRLQACLAFVHAIPGIQHIVVGVNNADQLRAILDAAEAKAANFPDRFSSEDPLLINPLGWLKI